jgi:hypothetical protein
MASSPELVDLQPRKTVFAMLALCNCTAEVPRDFLTVRISFISKKKELEGGTRGKREKKEHYTYLQAIADPEDRHAKLKDVGIDVRRIVVID